MTARDSLGDWSNRREHAERVTRESGEGRRVTQAFFLAEIRGNKQVLQGSTRERKMRDDETAGREQNVLRRSRDELMNLKLIDSRRLAISNSRERDFILGRALCLSPSCIARPLKNGTSLGFCSVNCIIRGSWRRRRHPRETRRRFSFVDGHGVADESATDGARDYTSTETQRSQRQT